MQPPPQDPPPPPPPLPADYVGCLDKETGKPMAKQLCEREILHCYLDAPTSHTFVDCKYEGNTCAKKLRVYAKSAGDRCSSCFPEESFKYDATCLPPCKHVYWSYKCKNFKVCYAKKYMIECEQKDLKRTSLGSSTCSPKPGEPPVVEGRDGGFYVPNQTCYTNPKTPANMCGNGSCDLFATRNKLSYCDPYPAAARHFQVSDKTKCGAVTSPNAEWPFARDRFMCGDVPRLPGPDTDPEGWPEKPGPPYSW